MPRPKAIVFDVIETLFSLETLRDRLAAEGLPRTSLEAVFASILRDAFALDTCGIYQPFAEVAGAVLGTMGLDEEAQSRVLAGFKELQAHDDVQPALERVRAVDLPAICLTNGNAEVTKTLLERNGLDGLVAQVISIDEIGRWKPAQAVYDHAAQTAGLAPKDLALVAAHGWDCQGAKSAGLSTAYVNRTGPRSAVMIPADIEASTADDAVAGLLA